MPITRLLVPLALTCLAVMPMPAGSARASEVETSFSRHAAGSQVTVDHSAWDKLLATYVRPAEDGLNRVSYKRFKAEGHGALDAYLTALQKVDPTRLDRPEQFAFWANLYNAKTIDVVLDAYPVRSIKDINLGGGLFASITGGPWKAKIVTVNGHPLSLDDIEHTIMRGIFKDHRVHFAVNCASVGCPNLGAVALTGAHLDELLEQGGRAFVNSGRGVLVDGGKIRASKIFSWFQADFGGSERGVLEHLQRYAAPALKLRLSSVTAIADYFYDWQLNDAKD
jgi:hypothetical protein